MRWLIVLLGLVSIGFGGLYVYSLTQRSRCVGLDRNQVIALARRQLPIEIGKYYSRPALEVRPSDLAISAARVVQFVDWHNPRDGFEVVFAIAGEKEYWSMSISGACSVRTGQTSELLPQI